MRTKIAKLLMTNFGTLMSLVITTPLWDNASVANSSRVWRRHNALKHEPAYEKPSDLFKKFLSNFKAAHESKHIYNCRYSNRGVDDVELKYPKAIYPIIRTHPKANKNSLFVNKNFITMIEGLLNFESRKVLDALFEHCESLEFHIKYQRNLFDMVFGDNRCSMRMTLSEHWPMERKGERITFKGYQPF